jgi:O-antigen/teichoic acid export membrane protein
MSQLKKGALLSYLSIFLTNGIGLLLTPYIIHKLGDSEYGLYTLIGSLIAYIGVLDFGLNNTIIRFVAKYRAQNDKPGEENFLATSLLIYAAISTLIVIAGIALYYNLETLFPKLTVAEMSKAKLMFVVLIFNLAIELPGGAFAAICSAYEQFVFPRALKISEYVLRSLMVVALLWKGGDAISIVVLDTILNLFVIVISAYYVFRKLQVKIKLHVFQFPLVKTIFSYSVWIFVYAIVGQFQWRFGQVVLGMLSGTTAVAIYGVGIMLGTYYGAFSAAISSVFLPRATKMTVLDATPAELTSMMIKIGRFSFLILLLILGGFFLFGQQFVLLWVGKTYSDSWIIAFTIMVSYTVPLVQTFANSILEATNRFYFKSLTYIFFIVLGTALGAFLVKDYGSLGLLFGSTLGWIISQVVMNIYYQKVMKLELRRFFSAVSDRIVPAFLLLLVLGYFLNYLPGSGWMNLVSKIAVFVGLFAVIMFQLGMNEFEKQTVLEFLPFYKKKQRPPAE